MKESDSSPNVNDAVYESEPGGRESRAFLNYPFALQHSCFGGDDFGAPNSAWESGHLTILQGSCFGGCMTKPNNTCGRLPRGSST